MTTSEYIDLFNNQYKYLLNFCHTCGVSKEESEDITSHSFYIFWRKKENIHAHTASTYLFTLAKNKCIDTVRRKHLREKIYSNLSHSDSHTDPFSNIDFKLIAAHVYEIIELLPPKQKEYITLRYLYDMPIEKIIKERSNINRNTLKNTLQRATDKIRDELKSRGITLG